MTDSTTFDIVILGGGSGGYACALRAVELGLTVALIEKDKLGGTCLHRGCIPTKALLHAAEVAESAAHGASVGVRSTFEGIDMAALHTYKDGVIGRLHKGLTGLVKAGGITYVTGHGTVTSPTTVEVDGTTYTGKNLVLATGSKPSTIGIEITGRVMTSDGALALQEVPGHVAVLGGGVIGCELASAFRSFGSQVTIIEAMDRLLPPEDPASSKALERAFKKRKIAVKTSTRFAGVTQTEDKVTVQLEGAEPIEADILLVAVGRGPVTADLGYEAIGIEMDRGYVLADERCRTNIEGVRAVGDIVPGLQLAHRGFAQGIFVAEDIAGLEPAPIVESTIPRITYTEPEVASVGITEAKAKEIHGEDGVKTVEFNLGGNGKSQMLGTSGFVKVVRKVDGPVIGIHMVGARMGEQVGEAQLIVGWEAMPEEVAAFIHAHPTQNEALGEAHLALAGKPLHAHN